MIDVLHFSQGVDEIKIWEVTIIDIKKEDYIITNKEKT